MMRPVLRPESSLHYKDAARKRLSANQEEGPRQTQELGARDLGLPSLQNCEKSVFVALVSQSDVLVWQPEWTQVDALLRVGLLRLFTYSHGWGRTQRENPRWAPHVPPRALPWQPLFSLLRIRCFTSAKMLTPVLVCRVPGDTE